MPSSESSRIWFRIWFLIEIKYEKVRNLPDNEALRDENSSD